MEEQLRWNVKSVTKEEYEFLVPNREIFFNEPDFVELNRHKVDKIHYLVIFRENSARFGMIAGQRHEEMFVPFSAPYLYT